MACSTSHNNEVCSLTFIFHTKLNLVGRSSLRLDRLLKPLPGVITGIVVFTLILLFIQPSLFEFLLDLLSYGGEVSHEYYSYLIYEALCSYAIAVY